MREKKEIKKEMVEKLTITKIIIVEVGLGDTVSVMHAEGDIR